MRFAVMEGNCLDWLRELADCSVDSVVTDPPAGIAFMAKKWDTFSERDAFIAFLQGVMEECFRVLKPGGHALVWGIPRTAHWTATAIENAGFEIRDTIAHIFGQGFPKNLDVAKAIQKSSGVQPIGEKPASLGMAKNPQWNALNRQLIMPEPEGQAAVWEGWGTALKPAREDWILARKPLEGTVAANVLKWGTGAINIDGCRIACEGGSPSEKRRQSARDTGRAPTHPGAKDGSVRVAHVDRTSPERYMEARKGEEIGRYPANVIFDEEAAALLDAQSGTSKSTKGKPRGSKAPGAGWGMTQVGAEYEDEGGASRFFYVAKPSRREKEAGCEHLPRKTAAELTGRQEGSAGLVMKHDDGSEKANPYAGTSGAQPRANHHPTVKPVALMRYLCRMVTPPGGLVLDPFCGSGTTGVGAVLEGFRFFGIDQDADYVRIAQARIEHALKGES